VRVLVDASALSDARRDAGIGRYVRAMLEALGRQPGIEVVPVRPFTRPPVESWPVRFINAQPALTVAWIRRGRPLVHAMSSDPMLLCPPARQVVTLHDVIPWAGPAQGMYLRMQRSRLRRAAAIIVPSTHVAGRAVDVLGLERSRVHVVAEGVDPAFRPDATDAEPAAAAIAAPGTYLLWVGSLVAHDPRKALDVLLDATAGLEPRPAVVLAGARGAEADRVAARGRALGLDLRLPGWVADSELAALYRGSLAAVFPSLDEGFGLPALEALACGALLVASAIEPVTAIAGDAALLATPGDVVSLRAALHVAMTLPPEARGMRREAGLRRAATYTWAAAAATVADLYRDVDAAYRDRARSAR